jgi:hypothetical protein
VDSLGDAPCRGDIRLGQDDAKLLASVPAGDIGEAKGPPAGR